MLYAGQLNREHQFKWAKILLFIRVHSVLCAQFVNDVCVYNAIKFKFKYHSVGFQYPIQPHVLRMNQIKRSSDGPT